MLLSRTRTCKETVLFCRRRPSVELAIGQGKASAPPQCEAARSFLENLRNKTKRLCPDEMRLVVRAPRSRGPFCAPAGSRLCHKYASLPRDRPEWPASL